MKTIIAALVAGIVLFMWGFVSWTLLPLHDVDVHSFTDEGATMQTLLEQAPESGIYYIPSDEADYSVDTPNAFVNINKEGYQRDMSGMMIGGLLANIVMALLAAFLLGMTTGLSYAQRVGFVVTTGLLIGVAANVPYWNWFGFPTMYTLVQILDSIIMWFFAGLVLAKLVPERG